MWVTLPLVSFSARMCLTSRPTTHFWSTEWESNPRWILFTIHIGSVVPNHSATSALFIVCNSLRLQWDYYLSPVILFLGAPNGCLLNTGLPLFTNKIILSDQTQKSGYFEFILNLKIILSLITMTDFLKMSSILFWSQFTELNR